MHLVNGGTHKGESLQNGNRLHGWPAVRQLIFMKLFKNVTLAILGALILSMVPARADDVYTIIVKKQEDKEKTRGYLADWFETKQKFRMMDMWLALHSPSPYEFFVGTDYRVSDDHKDDFPGNTQLHFGAYASIFGLEINKTMTEGGEFTGLFALRVFGYHVQSTNLTLQFGLRSQGSPAYRDAVGGLAYTLYLMKPFGLTGFWRHYFDSTPNSTGNTVSGDRFELGPFLDFGILRFDGGYFHETITTSSNGASSDAPHSGVFLGTKIFF